MTNDIFAPITERLESAASYANQQGQFGHAQTIVEAIGLIEARGKNNGDRLRSAINDFKANAKRIEQEANAFQSVSASIDAKARIRAADELLTVLDAVIPASMPSTYREQIIVNPPEDGFDGDKGREANDYPYGNTPE